MSETSTTDPHITLKERLTLAQARFEELEPALVALADHAKGVYGELRDSAEHVGAVDRNFPLRHQQVHGPVPTIPGGPAGASADYLMINLGIEHHMTLYRNFAPSPSFNYQWRFDRAYLVGSMISEVTTLTDGIDPPVGSDKTMDFEVVQYEFPEQVGRNGRSLGIVCSALALHPAAEHYIADFNADLDRAIELYY